MKSHRGDQIIFLSADYRTASVIIALTDGELHEDLFYYAEREVRDKKKNEIGHINSNRCHFDPPVLDGSVCLSVLDPSFSHLWWDIMIYVLLRPFRRSRWRCVKALSGLKNMLTPGMK